jgi:RNA-directed DNA polymerase
MLGIPTVADRIAQTVVAMYLEPLVEPHFHPDSYGYRPKKSALQAVGVARERCWRFDWVIDLDVRGFFDSIDRGWLVKFIEHRIADRRVVRLIQKWLNAGVLEDGKRIDGRGDAAGRQRVAAALQRLSPLCVRPLGPGVAPEASPRRHDCRPVCR